VSRRIAALRQSEARTSQLPPDLLEDAARRLAIASLAMAAALGVSIPLSLLVEGEHLREPRPYARALMLTAVLLSLAVYALARRKRLKPHQFLTLGATYEVLLCLLISLIERLGPFPQGDYREVSWVCLVIVLFPSLVPQRPVTTLATALTAAGTGPAAYLISLQLGYLPQRAGDLALQTAFSVAAACLALAPSFVIFRLAKNLNEARELGSYRLEALLGKGGMGEVWRAHHQLLARPAAVKLIRGDNIGHEALERFRREAKATAQLRSQHTVSLYDFGYTPEGTFYYAMELLDGCDLDSVEAPLPPARVVHILSQVCLSLEEAHQAGLVHRDIKPANLFLARQGVDLDHVKVLDFGLVVQQTDSRLTSKDSLYGTPETMAPEQIRGEELTPQTDLYALGCVAYQLLSGHRVFDGRNVHMTVMGHLNDEPAPLGQDDLSRLVMECLAKAPEARPSSAKELRSRLLQCSCAGGWSEEDARAWWSTKSADRPRRQA